MSSPIEIIDDLFQKIIGPFAATQVGPLLHEPDNIDERVQLLVDTFNKNPSLINPFRTLIKSLHTQEGEVPFEEQIRFYTTKHTRYWVIVNLFNQVLNLKELHLDEATGRLPGAPDTLLKYAHQAIVTFGEESRYKDLAFAVGLYFDFLFYLQRTPFLEVGTLKYDEPINQAFVKANDQGKIIVKLSKFKSKLTLEKLAPITPYVRQLAQLCLTLLRPAPATEFYKKLGAMKTNEPLKLALEMQAFGVHTGIISAYLAQSIQHSDALGEAMSVWGFPYLSWISGRRDVHDLAGMGELGVSIGERLKGGDFPGAGVVGNVLPELKFLEFSVSAEVKSEIKI